MHFIFCSYDGESLPRKRVMNCIVCNFYEGIVLGPIAKDYYYFYYFYYYYYLLIAKELYDELHIV